MASSYSNLHPVDEILTSLVGEAVPSDNQLIADKVFENITIPQRSGTLLLEESRNFTGAAAGLDIQRAPGASRVTIGGFDRSSQTYMAHPYGLREAIAMLDIRDSQYPGSEEARMAKKIARAVKLAREKRAADLLFGTTNFSDSNCTAEFGGKWNVAGAEPLSDLHELKDTVFAAAHGINPDSLVMGREVFRQLARNPEVRGYVGSSSAGIASGNRILNDEAVLEVLRDVLGIPNVYVGQARQDTAVPGATANESYIWTGDSLFMGILHGSDAIVQKSGNVKGMPVAALNLQYQPIESGQWDSNDGIRRYVWAEEINVFHAVDSTLGYIITDCL